MAEVSTTFQLSGKGGMTFGDLRVETGGRRSRNAT
jgi:hypothetical protein